MPEGDTVFRAARTLNRALSGCTVTGFDTVFPPLSRIDQDYPIVGRTIESVESQGKWMLMRFSGDLTLLTHMRMNGSWHIYRPGETWRRGRHHMRVVIETADFVAVGFDVPVAEFHGSASLARHPSLTRLGPDVELPLESAVLLRFVESSGSILRKRACGEHRCLGARLLRAPYLLAVEASVQFFFGFMICHALSGTCRPSKLKMLAPASISPPSM